MMPTSSKDTHIDRSGLFGAIFAYTFWGVFPVYFVATNFVSATELLAHRIVWSVPFGLLIILARKQIGSVIKALITPKVVGLLTLAAVALSVNWGVYIWAVQNEQIFQGSLGYYITPLIYVIIGVVFLGERLRRAQAGAVLLAAMGVLTLTIYGGVFPIIALILAASFTTYGTIRKQVDVGAMPGLFIETLLLFLPALGYLVWQFHHSELAFVGADITGKTLVLLAGPFTVIPLLAFAVAARRLRLSTLAFLQFIGPTLQFACGLYYGEVFTPAHAICFTFIWIAVGIFSWDAIKNQRKSL